MSLYKQIKADQMSARKAKEAVKAALLTTMLGDIQSALVGGKKAPEYEEDGTTLKVADETVLSTVKKFITSAQETLKSKENEASRLELEVLESYLPKQLSDEELKAAIESILVECTLEGGKRMGFVVGELKKQYPGQFDAGKVKGFL